MIIDGSIYSLINLGYDGRQGTSLWSLGCYKSPQFEVYVPEDVVQRARKRVEDESLGWAKRIAPGCVMADQLIGFA